MKEKNRFTDLLTLVRLRAAETPGKQAFAFLKQGEHLDGELTFAALERRARAIGSHLQSQGPVGTRALLLYPPGLAFIEAFLGCLYAGFIAVPVNAPHARHKRGHWHRLMSIIEDCDAGLVLCSSGIHRAMRTGLATVDQGRSRIWFSTDEIENQHAAAWQPPAIDGNTIAFLQYTSGSTSNPKGVMVTHGNLLHNLALMREAFDNDENTVLVSWLPLFHDLGLIGGVLQTLYLGASCYLMAPAAFLQKPLRWLQTISRFQAHSSMSPNFGYELCVRRVTEANKAELDLSSWTHALNGAEPIRAATLDLFCRHFGPCGFRRQAFYPAYGLAEATLVVTGAGRNQGPVTARFDRDALGQGLANPVGENDQEHQTLVSSGRLWGGQSLVIVQPESRALLPPGKVGEVWVEGPSVAAGYCNHEEITKDTFAAHPEGSQAGPFLRTGDLGFLLDGELFITGRRKELIIIHGRNHYPQDIEQTVQVCHPALRRDHGAAFAVEVEEEERLIVVQEVERTYRKHIDADLLNTIVRTIAEEHELEVHEVVLIRPNSLPKTSSGKIQRGRCREQYLGNDLVVLARGGFTVPSVGEVSREKGKTPAGAAPFPHHLIELLAPMLRVTPKDFRPDLRFAHYGLSSRQMVSISGELGEALDRDLPDTLLYDYPTPIALARFLAKGEEAVVEPPDTGLASGREEPIAVIGVGCRLPGGITNLDDLWAMLTDGRDTITEIPAARWNPARDYYPQPGTPGKSVMRMGSFLEAVDHFDAEFFAISGFEAERMDPQQRMVLEVGWHALEDAGIQPSRLAGTASGVFLGISDNDYCEIHAEHPAMWDAQAGVGNALSIAANRLSYVLDLAGPSMAVDTACSSSLTAIHLARQSLRLGECTLAIAGGVNLLLSARGNTVQSQAQMLSPGKGCRSFDAEADGYVRGEGCGLVVLKRLSDAQRDGDRIYALIRGSAVNQNGTGAGLTVPNGAALEAVMGRALAEAAVASAQVDYVEAQGTGTPLGDAIEARALGRVFRRGRPEERPLRIGSIKTQLGHLEAASGMCGLFKLILAMGHRMIPGSPRISKANPQIPWGELKLSLVHRTTPWRRQQNPRLAGLNAFGVGGANAHLVLEEPPLSAPGEDAPQSYHLLTLSAKTDRALESLARSYRDYLLDFPERSLADICFTAYTGRDHFSRRLALVGASREVFLDGLTAFLEKRTRPGTLFHGSVEGNHAEPIPLRENEAGDERFSAATAPSTPEATPGLKDEAGELTSLQASARAYTRGEVLNGAAFNSSAGAKRVSLPTYPFARKRYWIAGTDRHKTGITTGHPLLGAARQTALLASGQQLFEARAALHHPPYLSDYRLGGQPVFPFACFLEMAFAAAQQLGITGGVALREVSLNHVPPLSEHGLSLQTITAPEHDGYRFEIFGLQDEGSGSDWKAYASGSIRPHGATAPLDPDAEPLPSFEGKEVQDREGFYEKCGLKPGPAFSAVHQAFTDGDEVWARLSLPPMLAYSRKSYRFHPVMLDACFQPLWLLGKGSPQIDLTVSAIGELTLWGEVGETLWVRARGNSYDEAGMSDAGRTNSGSAVDMEIRGERGELVGRMSGIQLQFHSSLSQPSHGNPTGSLDHEALQATDPAHRPAMLQAMLADLLVVRFGFDRRQLSENRALNRLGLDSLLAIRLKYRIQQELNLAITVPDLLKDTTLAELADHLLRELCPDEVPEAGTKTFEPEMNDADWVEVLV